MRMSEKALAKLSNLPPIVAEPVPKKEVYDASPLLDQDPSTQNSFLDLSFLKADTASKPDSKQRVDLLSSDTVTISKENVKTLSDEATFDLTGDSSNDSETTGSQRTCGSVDFSDMDFDLKTPTTQVASISDSHKFTPSLLASPKEAAKLMEVEEEKDLDPKKVEQTNKEFVVNNTVDFPPEIPPRPLVSPGKFLPMPDAPDSALSPNTLFHKPMDTLVGELQKLMSGGPAPPPPNVNKTRKRCRINHKVSFVKRPVKRKLQQPQQEQETCKQRRESVVASPPQYESQKPITNLPEVQSVEEAFPEDPHFKMMSSFAESPTRGRQSTDPWFKLKPPSTQTPTIKPTKRQREPSPEPVVEKVITQVFHESDSSKTSMKRSKRERKYNFRFKRRKPNNPESEEEQSKRYVRTELKFAQKLTIDAKRWNDMINLMLSVGIGDVTMIEMPTKFKFRSFSDGMFADQVHSQELIRKKKNLFMLSQTTQEISTEDHRFQNCVRMIRNDNDHRLIDHHLYDKSPIERLQEAFSDLATFCSQNGAAPTKLRVFSNFDFDDKSSIDIGKLQDAAHVILGENKLPGVTSKQRYFSMIGSVTPLHEECLQLGSVHYNRGPTPLYVCIVHNTRENKSLLKTLRNREGIQKGLEFVHPKALEIEGITFEHGFLPSGHMLVMPCGCMYQTLSVGFSVWESIAICSRDWLSMFMKDELVLQHSELESLAYPANFNICTAPGRKSIVTYWESKLKKWKYNKRKSSLSDARICLPREKLQHLWQDYQSTNAFRTRLALFPFPRNFITRFHIFQFETKRPLRVNSHVTMTNGFCTLWDNPKKWKSLSITTNFDDHMIAFCVWVVRNNSIGKLAADQKMFKSRLSGDTRNSTAADLIKSEWVYPYSVQLYPHEIVNLRSFKL